MATVVLATGNAGKLAEFRSCFEGSGVRFLSLKEIGFEGDVVEDGKTFRENAEIKARAVASFLDRNPDRAATVDAVLADDSGLEVAALGGAPGIHTARFAGPGATNSSNIDKLLGLLEGAADRRARFVCTLCLLRRRGGSWSGTEFCDGACEGTILEAREGAGGFGYDPVFRPEGRDVSFALMDGAEKDRISHRGRAIQALRALLGV